MPGEDSMSHLQLYEAAPQQQRGFSLPEQTAKRFRALSGLTVKRPL